MSRIVGIDLGTSTSEIAILENKKPFVITNESGEKIIPSIVGISEEGNIIVGRDAKDQFILRPKDTVIEVKRLMGSNENVTIGGKSYSPQEISSFILKYLKEVAENHIGEKVERAVITVPAYFTDIQRRATVEAGKLAGFKVERIINEPTAAALAYGTEHMEDEQHILVYDLGGGTLDVTVLEMFDGVLEVKASSGNNHLGGKDFDQRLIDDIIEEFEKQNIVKISEDVHALAKIKEASEACKIALSSKEKYDISIPFIAEKDGNPIAIERTITRQYFENLISDLVDSTIQPIKNSLKDAKLTKEDIDVILLVGGSTKVPIVKRIIEDTLDKEAVSLVDPDLAVVMGAAIQAGIINNELSSEEDILITDVCPYTLGVETMAFMNDFPVFDLYDVIIHRNTSIPVTREEVYSTSMDYQDKVEIKIYQGDSKRASKNNFLGKFMLTEIPPALSGKEKVKVRFMYDINGILQVEATILSTGNKAGITIETTGVEYKEEVDLDKWEQAPNIRKYKRIINKAEKVLENLDDIFMHEELEELVKDLKRALIKEEDRGTIEEIKEELSDLIYDLEEEEC